MDEKTTQVECGLLERAVGIGQVEPAGEARFAARREKLDWAQSGKFLVNGFGKLRLHGDPDAIVASGFGILFLAKEKDDLAIDVDGMAAEHGTRVNASGELRIVQFVENEREGG